MGIETRELRRNTAALDHLRDAGVGEPALGREPQRVELGIGMVSPSPEVAVERLRRLGTERTGAQSSPLAHHDDDVHAEVDVGEGEAAELG